MCIRDSVFPALQTLAVKTWTGKETSLPFEVYNEKRSAISEAPGVNQLGRDVYKRQVTNNNRRSNPNPKPE